MYCRWLCTALNAGQEQNLCLVDSVATVVHPEDLQWWDMVALAKPGAVLRPPQRKRSAPLSIKAITQTQQKRKSKPKPLESTEIYKGKSATERGFCHDRKFTQEDFRALSGSQDLDRLLEEGDVLTGTTIAKKAAQVSAEEYAKDQAEEAKVHLAFKLAKITDRAQRAALSAGKHAVKAHEAKMKAIAAVELTRAAITIKTTAITFPTTKISTAIIVEPVRTRYGKQRLC